MFPWKKLEMLMPENAFSGHFGKASLSPVKVDGNLSAIAGKV